MRDDADGAGESAPLTGAVLDNRVGQKLMKVIGNVCFSFFVASVLVVTVIAITYKPPDPWLDTSQALSSSFSDTLRNSTFQTDDSLLPTAEDLQQPPPQQPSPPPQVEIFPASGNLTAGSPSCSGSSLNCSDPAVLAAITRFNSKIFSKSIVFLAYETPVPGSKSNECDAAWSFRNKKEKSWRRYRDYRRFRLVAVENCTFRVSWAGKFRSGANAARRIRPATFMDANVNDTIPLVGSEGFRKGRYLYYSRGGDYCKGMNQYIWSFLCGLGEARFLNRTFVLDLSLCLATDNKAEEGKDFRNYFDLEHLKESSSIVGEEEFLNDWRIWDQALRGKKKKKGSRITVRKVSTYKITPMQLSKEKSTIIWRQFGGPEPENYWYRVCEGRAARYIQRPWEAIWKSRRLMDIVTEIAGRLDWDYDAVHVVRGQKAANKNLWPHLDADTSPEALVAKLTKTVKEWRNLYIATNEPFYNYFDKLRSHYKVHLLDDYKELWGPKSEWYNETTIVNGGKPIEFDAHMRVAVDTEVFYRAKNRVETFNNLTSDCKEGINAC